MSCSIALDFVTNDFTYNFKFIHILNTCKFMLTLIKIDMMFDTNKI